MSEQDTHLFPYRVPGVSFFKRADKNGPADPWMASYLDPLTGKRATRAFSVDADETATELMKLVSQTPRPVQADARLDRVAQMQTRPLLGRWEKGMMIAGHLEDYRDWLIGRGRTRKHVAAVYSHARKMIRLCRFQTTADVWAEDLEMAVAKYLRKARDKSLKTCNDHLKHTAQFIRWMASPKIARASHNPLSDVEKYNAATDVRRPRRALSCSDFLRVLEVTRTRGPYKQMTADARVMYYLVKVQTGLRNEETESLTPENFDLSGLTNTVKIAAAFSKHRRLDVLPIDPTFAQELRHWLKGKPAGVPIFPVDAKPWIMWREDLEAAGVAYQDANGFADLYALRHTFATQLGASGASMKVVQKLMRHCDIRQTERYMHPSGADALAALASLPRPIAQQFKPQHADQVCAP